MFMESMPTGAVVRVGGADRKTLVRDALDASLDVRTCNLDFWLREVATRFGALRRGRCEDAVVPPWMLEDGPLRTSIMEEFGFRARTEEAAVRSITHMVRCAPSLAAMDFYATQLVDEARHAFVFRHHLVDLGVEADRVDAEVQRISGDKVSAIIEPLERFIEPTIAREDFIGMVVFLGIIAEGALAPAAEMSTLRWADVDPPAAEIGYGANLDEIRHLGVGTSLVREHVLRHPHERARLLEMIQAGLGLFAQLPLAEALVRRERLFQEGLRQHHDRFRGFEFVNGRLLVDTTVEERLGLQQRWSDEMRTARMIQMGLVEA
jgi:hypothetical protein